jgi:hypothetical protein
MWSHEHTAETKLPAEAVWQVLADLNSWTSWDTSMQGVRLLGPFRVGTEVAMTPKDQDEIRSTIVDIQPQRRYADRTHFGNATLEFSHTLTPLEDGRTRVTHRLTINGPNAEQLGQMITADFPDAMAALLAASAARYTPPCP